MGMITENVPGAGTTNSSNQNNVSSANDLKSKIERCKKVELDIKETGYSSAATAMRQILKFDKDLTKLEESSEGTGSLKLFIDGQSDDATMIILAALILTEYKGLIETLRTYFESITDLADPDKSTGEQKHIQERVHDKCSTKDYYGTLTRRHLVQLLVLFPRTSTIAALVRTALVAVVFLNLLLKKRVSDEKSLINFINLHLSVFGSKRYFAHNVLTVENSTLDFKNTIMVELMGRTAAITINIIYLIGGNYIGDVDDAFINLMYVLRDHPFEFVEEMKAVYTYYGLTVARRKDTDYKGIAEQIFNDKKKSLPSEYEAMSTESKIESAVSLYLLINLSYNGSITNFGINTGSNILMNFENIYNDILMAVPVLRLLNYEKSDFRVTVRRFSKNVNVFFIVDPPYLIKWGFACLTYDSKFTLEDMGELIALLVKVKGKVLFFHDWNDVVHEMLTDSGFNCIGYYCQGNNKTYLYTLNISEDEVKSLFKNIHPTGGR